MAWFLCCCSKGDESLSNVVRDNAPHESDHYIARNPPPHPDTRGSVVEVPETPVSAIVWVVGLDFGTTYSGFSYTKVGVSNDITTYYDWPSKSHGKPYCKTLTGIHYEEKEPGRLEPTSWGHYARSNYQERHCGRYLSKFKLLLKKGLNDAVLASSIPSQLNLETIITDYLRFMGKFVWEVLKNHEGEAHFNEKSVQWCLTVPSIWDDAAKRVMKTCMVNAGLVSGDSRKGPELKIVLEPEAASFHCHQVLQKIRKGLTFHRMDKILVADVGGGTVDIVVQEIVGIGSDYKVKELTESSGSLCGGTYVDELFLEFMSKKIGCLDEFLRSVYPSYKTRLLQDWESIKFAFGTEDSDSYVREIVLHKHLAPLWETYERDRGYPPRDSYHEVELTQRNIESIFDPVVEKIMQNIATQLSLVHGIKMMFVVGGFASSHYLMQKIRARFSRVVEFIESPPYSGSAISQGAVGLALNPDVVVARCARKTYGTSVDKKFEPGVDPASLQKLGKRGFRYCRNRFDVFVKKGDLISVNDVITKRYHPSSDDQRQIKFDVFSSNLLEPRYTECPDVTKEMEVVIDLPTNWQSTTDSFLECSMYFGRTSIELRAKFTDHSGGRIHVRELPVQY